MRPSFFAVGPADLRDWSFCYICLSERLVMHVSVQKLSEHWHEGLAH